MWAIHVLFFILYIVAEQVLRSEQQAQTDKQKKQNLGQKRKATSGSIAASLAVEERAEDAKRGAVDRLSLRIGLLQRMRPNESILGSLKRLGAVARSEKEQTCVQHAGKPSEAHAGPKYGKARV